MSMYYSPNCKPDIKLNLEMGSVGVGPLVGRQSEGGGNGGVVEGDKGGAKPSVLALEHRAPPEWGKHLPQ